MATPLPNSRTLEAQVRELCAHPEPTRGDASPLSAALMMLEELKRAGLLKPTTYTLPSVDLYGTVSREMARRSVDR